tara:strand:- start:25 stop:402 length:378 start_codon:yes stop_codon:yes gene_type:complete
VIHDLNVAVDGEGKCDSLDIVWRLHGDGSVTRLKRTYTAHKWGKTAVKLHGDPRSQGFAQSDVVAHYKGAPNYGHDMIRVTWTRANLWPAAKATFAGIQAYFNSGGDAASWRGAKQMLYAQIGQW